MTEKKLIWTLVIVAVVGVFGGRAWYLHKQSVAEKDVVKIGAILPMSGVLAANGESAKNSMLMAEELFNKQNHPVKVQLVIEDGKFTAKDSISAFRKLQSSGVDIILPYGDVTAKAILPLLKEKNQPLFAFGGLEELATSYENTISLLPNPRYLIGQSPAFIISDLKKSDIAIIYQHEPAVESTTKEIIESINTLGGKVVAQEQFTINSADTHSIVAKVLSKNPEAVIVFGWGPAYTAILNDLRQQLFAGPIITDNNISSSKDALANNGDGIYVFDILFDYDLDIPLIQNFLRDYKQRYNAVPDIFAVYAYETFLLLAEAIDTKNYDLLKMKDKILQTNKQETLVGPISFYPNRLIAIHLVIKQMQADGSAKIVKE